MNPARRGKLIAELLTGSWRQELLPPTLSTSLLSELAPLLMQRGSAGLVWRRVRRSALAGTATGRLLEQAYLSSLGRALQLEARLVQVCRLLGSVGVQPLVAKGWAIARLYPDPALRPYADIDLCVLSSDYSKAAQVLRESEAHRWPTDLHARFRLLDRSMEQLYERSQAVDLEDLKIRIPSPEDHLRLMSLHSLDHGLYRPLWLCDLAVAVESLPLEFDWSYFLSGDPRYSDWVLCALALTAGLLGAELPAFKPLLSRSAPLPRWLVPAVLKTWGEMEHYMHSLPLRSSLGRPRDLWPALRLRWPNAIEATVHTRGPFNNFPRLPFQLSECLRRTGRFLGGRISLCGTKQSRSRNLRNLS